MAKSTKSQTTTATPALTPDGRPLFDTLGRSNLVKRGPKAGSKSAAAKVEPQLTPDGRPLFDTLGRSNLIKRGPKAKVA